VVDHLVKSYDEELRSLKGLAVSMGELTNGQLEAVVSAVQQTDALAAQRVIEREPEADRLEHRIDNAVIQVLARRQPVAIDLRHVLSALRIANELERICDHAEDIARRLMAMRDGTAPPHSLIELARFAIDMVKDSMRAFVEKDAELAQAVWNRGRELDEMYNGLFRELLTYMMEDPRRISATTQALFIARDIERIGDRATNIAEIVRYLVSGVWVEEERPKADATKSMTVPVGG